jgi:undecaprenyl-diphosphatase
MSTSTLEPVRLPAALPAAERFAVPGADHPWATIAGAYAATWTLLCAVMTGVGLLLTHVVLAGGRGGWDDSINAWLAERRQPVLDAVTSRATSIANTLPVVALLGACCLGLLILRRWREALFLASALAIEVSAFLVVNLIVERRRPDVPRLDSTPSTGSFPSGHVAASLALWCGTALLVSPQLRNRALRIVVWVVAIGVTSAVAFARVYRGMHHLTDVVAGVLLGAGALAAAAFVSTVVAVVVEERHRQRDSLAREETL